VRPNHCLRTRLVVVLVFCLALLVGISARTQSAASAPTEVDAASSRLYNFASSPTVWNPTVDIRWKYDGGSDVKLLTKKLFKSNEKAETFGFKMGRAWADGHMLDKR
jgi:hypothetical protein